MHNSQFITFTVTYTMKTCTNYRYLEDRIGIGYKCKVKLVIVDVCS